MLNEQRISRAEDALRPYQPGNSEREAIVDLLTDLHHLADAYKFDIDDAWRIAKNHQQTETS